MFLLKFSLNVAIVFKYIFYFFSSENCKFIEAIKLVNCVYIGDNALDRLILLESSLKNLEISNCGNVTDKGLGSLKKLS